MISDKIDMYFAKKGVDVRFNTLGHDELLVRSFVNDFKDIVGKSYSKKSNAIKLECYKKLYYFHPRKKLTGFERLKKQDLNFRDQIAQFIVESQFTPTLKIDGTEPSPAVSYKNALKASLVNAINPLLYLSGGIDSELVAHTLLDMKKEFTPVIFFWTDNQNNIINHDDVNQAKKFCSDHNLKPILKQINLEQLWATTEFKRLSIDMQISSTQLVTYSYLIDLMNSLLPGRTHLFGGEVRFFSTIEDNKPANIVFLEKVCPPGYNGGYYQAESPGSATLLYNNSTGIWSIGRTGFPTPTGTWTTTPAFSYEYLIDTATVDTSFGSGQIIPNTPTGWAPIDSTSTQICRVQGGSASSNWVGSFEIWVRSTTEPANICVSTITLAVEGTA